jgi:hypothetical protein
LPIRTGGELYTPPQLNGIISRVMIGLAGYMVRIFFLLWMMVAIVYLLKNIKLTHQAF